MDNSLDTDNFNIPDYSLVLSKLIGQISQGSVILQGLSRDFRYLLQKKSIQDNCNLMKYNPIS
jgi:hypothetical protein